MNLALPGEYQNPGGAAGHLGPSERAWRVLAAQGAHVLGLNTDGEVVKPSRRLYPHQWSWDTAFVAIGLAAIDLPAARANLDALFKGQWRNGMVPHIVFDPGTEGYFPGPDRWASAEFSREAPRSPLTSGICQPPLHALAVWHVLAAAEKEGGAAGAVTREWAVGIFPKLVAWHRFLARERVDDGSGLLQIFHGWESGMDNSPRFDGPYERVEVGAGLPAYRRRDLEHVTDAGQRPTDREYDRYLWLVEEAKNVHYDQTALRRSGSFRVGDVFFTAIFAAAGSLLAALAERLERPAEAVQALAQAQAARTAVLKRVSAGTGLASDLDLRTGQELPGRTIAGFAPLIAGDAPDDVVDRQVASLLGPEWAGYPGLRWPLPPSTSPTDPSFRRRSYWRGPVWPVMNWLLANALKDSGRPAEAHRLSQAALDQLRAGGLAEYYEPFTGERLGADNHSWTAAVTLDWLCRP